MVISYKIHVTTFLQKVASNDPWSRRLKKFDNSRYSLLGGKPQISKFASSLIK